MRYLTAGESHGPKLTAILEGIPAGLTLTEDDINKELKRRQAGYGRGQRMLIESDCIEISSGLRHGVTLGSPITLSLVNRDFKNWSDVMSISPVEEKKRNLRQVTKPRPGHADLVGGIKYGFSDLRNSLERSSARETAMRVAVGAIAKRLLAELDIVVASHVTVFGGIEIDVPEGLTAREIQSLTEKSELAIVRPEREAEIKAYIDQIKKEGNTLGGIIETRVDNVPVGLGSYVHWDRKLDGKLAQAVLSINAFKGVEFGLGFQAAYHKGSEVMDEIAWSEAEGYTRLSNNLGGFEGGVSNGQPLLIRAVMKPIPTLYKPLMSVDIRNHQPHPANVERSDPTAVPAAAVVMENVVATVIASELLATFSADTMADLKEAVSKRRRTSQSF